MRSGDATSFGPPYTMDVVSEASTDNKIYRVAGPDEKPSSDASISDLIPEIVRKLIQEVDVHCMNICVRKPQELLEIESILRDDIPVIRRFTGGGTVIVDQGTIFVTFICNKDAVPGLQSYPQPIMSWSSLLYKKVFQGIGDFRLRENDYVLGDRKFGGNAQSITKNRWVHHTSFLWDYEISNMGYLKLPKRAPEYRQARGHLEFICRMKDYISRSNFIDRTIEAVDSQFLLRSAELETVECSLSSKFEPSSRLLTRQELGEAVFESPSANTASQSL